MPPLPLPTFDIACSCGARLRGLRQARHQVVSCPACASPRFVLPRSPLPDPASSTELPPPAGAPRAGRRPLRLVTSAGALVIAVAAILLLIALRPSRHDEKPGEESPSEEAEQRHVAEGQSALSEGAYVRARREFELALAIRDRLGGAPAERRSIAQLHRQSAILADLLAESPAEILRHFVGLPEAEWRELFRERYAGRSLLLDDTISRSATGEPRPGFRIAVPGGEARIDLGRLRVLHDVPLPQRMLLALRLADLRREPSGWSLLPDPDSGVLLTDPEMFAGLSLPADAELREILKRQREWLHAR